MPDEDKRLGKFKSFALGVDFQSGVVVDATGAELRGKLALSTADVSALVAQLEKLRR